MRHINQRDWIDIILSIWTNIIATIALIISIKKTAKRKQNRPRKRKRKR
ncbi:MULTISPECIES: hypothetical protein [Eubacterium]|nr:MULTISPECIES: hypothetical protein [Eubacterium]MBS4859181.1 hypothetical protein [Eubacterium limosum]